MSPSNLTQLTNSQTMFIPRQSTTSLTSRSPSTPITNPSRKLNIALLSTTDLSPRPIHNLINPTSLEHTSLDTTTCLERHIQCFSLNSSHELPPSLQNFRNTHQSAQSFNFLSTGFYLDSTLESDGIVNINRSLSLSPAKKTKEIAILYKPNLEIQFSIRVCFKRLYVRPFLLFCSDITYRTSPASFVCASLKFNFDPSTCTPRGTATFLNPFQDYHTPALLSSPVSSPERRTS